MKQSRISNYRPGYPKKLIRGTALAAAALMTIGSMGCKAKQQSAEPFEVPGTEHPEELVLDGDVAIDPGEDDLLEMGEPLPDESYDEIDDTGREGPALEGKIIVPEETENP